MILRDWRGRPKDKAVILTCVGGGWCDIVNRLIDDLLAIGWDGQIYQVKEKFGGLRFYIGEGTKEIFDRIDQAEEESERTCEQCGKPGVLREGGWLKTLCDEHAGDRKPMDWRKYKVEASI